MTVITDKIQNQTGGTVELVGQVAAKAWTHYNGITAAVRGSFNTSSIVDNGTGDYTVNFTNSMSDDEFPDISAADYRDTANWGRFVNGVGSTPSSQRIYTMNPTANLLDLDSVKLTVLGDLA